MPVATAPWSVDVLLDGTTWWEALGIEVREGLTASPKQLPSKLFYDRAGSALFERIAALPEYYLTRAEETLLRAHGREVMALIGPREIVELGSGSSRKIRWLLDGVDDRSRSLRYVPFDVDASIMGTALRGLAADYPFLHVHGVVGDFLHHLGRVPPRQGRRLVALLGSTLGNVHPAERRAFLDQVRRLLAPGDRVLLGLDLVKSPTLLELAYNDRAGVTAAFNRNILRVVNRVFDADFRPDAFAHRALYNATAARVEMHLVPDTAQAVRVRALDLRVGFEPGEPLWTESSYKFTLHSAAAMLADSDLSLESWFTDWRGLFALALAGFP